MVAITNSTHLIVEPVHELSNGGPGALPENFLKSTFFSLSIFINFFLPTGILDHQCYAASLIRKWHLSIELVVGLQFQTRALSLQRHAQALMHQYICSFPRVGEIALPACNSGRTSFLAGLSGGIRPNYWAISAINDWNLRTNHTLPY